MSVQQKQLEEEPQVEMKVEPKNWIDKMTLEIEELDFDTEYARELGRLKQAI